MMQVMTHEMKINDWHPGLADVSFSDDYKLKLSSKKLSSGKCQVKFYATVRGQRDLYGYVLVEADQTLKEVVTSIKRKLITIHHTRDFHHIHLYSIGKQVHDPLNFIVFDC
jgi:uncharacterized UPF0160 family protein